MMKLDVDSINRLSLSLIEKDKLDPEAAMLKLQDLKINLICGEEIRNSLPLQAALATAVNTGKRAFLGGVFVEMPAAVDCLLPWSNAENLNQIVHELGGVLSDKCDRKIFSLQFGVPALIDDKAMQVACNGWQGGVLVEGEVFQNGFEGNIPTAGIFAGSLGIALAFFRESGIYLAACDKSKGLSLWRPELHWLDITAKGPIVNLLPKKYWILGLGHLGQAYLWNISLLPYRPKDKAEIMLQDYERIVSGNWSAGLLCSQEDTQYKTRHCSQWLENQGFGTKITERTFDEYTKRGKEEPFLALCGFDNAKSRQPLEDAGFDLVVEVGLGNNLHTFDLICQHTFPNAAKTAKELWKNDGTTDAEINKIVLEVLTREHDGEDCGMVPISIAGKSVSASFVGACSGALAIAEILRGLHGGHRYDKIMVQLRNVEDVTVTCNKNQHYSIELVQNGLVNL
jgi:hypothetical protein